MIYLDNAATTKPISGLAALAERYESEQWANPSALYSAAVKAEARLEHARETVLRALFPGSGAAADGFGVIFTSCGSEANNQAILHGWRALGAKKLHFITSAYEHPCVYECFAALAEKGHDVDFLTPDENGVITEAALLAAIRPDTALISIMHVQNETGAINDIAALAAAAKRKNPGVLFHSDGVQGFCRLDANFKNIDYYTCSAHKIHGLKGVGALIYKSSAPPRALVLGGGQEHSLRSGTENTFGIAVFERAITQYLDQYAENIEAMRRVRSRICERLSAIPGAYMISPENCAPHLINISFRGVRGEVLLHALSAEGIFISTGSACSSKKGRLSRVHTSLGLPRDVSEGAVRISLCPENTEAEADVACAAIEKNVALLGRYSRK